MVGSVQDFRRDKLISLLKSWKDSGKFKTVADVCRHYPVDASYISQIKNGHRGFGEEAARTLEEALGLPKFYFEPHAPTVKDDGFNNIKVVDEREVRNVPVLNFVQAGNFCMYHDDAIADEYETVVGTYGARVYWVLLEGDSMEPDFKSGQLVLIDPDIQPNPADYVVAIKKGEKAVTFKKWRPRGFDEATGEEYWQLVPSNPDYPTIDSRFTPFTVCGVAIERRQKLR